MFERFTRGAREVVVGAQAGARTLGHGWIGTEHLLLATVSRRDDVGSTLGALGLTREAVRDALTEQLGAGHDDSTALRDLGIDLEAVRRRVEERFGAGALDAPRQKKARRRGPLGLGQHVPFTREAKKALELSLREALATGAKEIRVEHLVLGVLRAGGLATAVVARVGVRPDDVRRAVVERLGRAA
jgi:ATP-dependent Clp protease ATP-binding subunit ClpA